MTPPQPFPAIK